MSKRFFSLFCLLIGSTLPIYSHASETSLLAQLKIDQGYGEFKQKKFFKFLSKPIVSTGEFSVKPQIALWHTKTPVFSQVLLIDGAIHRRLSLSEPYQLMLSDTAFSRVLTAVFAGDISDQDWDINQNIEQRCVELTPKNQQLQQAFNQIEMCLLAENKRAITLFNQQGNKTEILMTMLAEEIPPLALKALQLNVPVTLKSNPDDQ